MKITFIDSSYSGIEQEKCSWHREVNFIPCVGDLIYRHVEFNSLDLDTSQFKNRWTVTGIYHCYETRAWYLDRKNQKGFETDEHGNSIVVEITPIPREK